jgi:rhodanese-related sulfurtransferase
MRIVTNIFILIVLVIATVPASASNGGWEWVRPDKVHELMKEGSGLWLIDVRGPIQFGTVHIEGAMNITPLDLKYRNYPKKKLFILVDTSPGQRMARESAELLVRKGHTNVFVLAGGLSEWELAGLPVIREGEFSPYFVTAKELVWALDNDVSMKVLDVRDESARGSGSIAASQPVAGKNMEERLSTLRARLAGSGSLSEKLRGGGPVVLISSASGDADEMARLLALELGMDVRYLQGGYEAYVVQVTGRSGEKKTVGQCPTCPLAK